MTVSDDPRIAAGPSGIITTTSRGLFGSTQPFLFAV